MGKAQEARTTEPVLRLYQVPDHHNVGKFRWQCRVDFCDGGYMTHEANTPANAVFGLGLYWMGEAHNGSRDAEGKVPEGNGR